MRCENFEERLSSHLDGMLNVQEREEVLAHLSTCRACDAHWNSMADLRARMRRMERPRFPAVLAIQLRVLASHERARRLARASFSARLRSWKEAILLNFENLMQPVALPVAGGVLSAMLLFGALLPTLVFRHQVTNDPPLSFISPDGTLAYLGGNTRGRWSLAPLSLMDPDTKQVDWNGEVPRLEPVDSVVSSDENVLELTIGNDGHVADWAVRQGQLTPEAANLILFSSFNPAMFFGRPTWGKILVVLPGHRRRSARG
jgi:hypothetical protein